MNYFKLLSILFAGILVAGSSSAGHPGGSGSAQIFRDRAKVVDVIPVYQDYGYGHDNDRGHGSRGRSVSTKSTAKITSKHIIHHDHPRYGYRELTGYKVKYKFRDHKYWTFTTDHPGRYIEVRVKLTPLG